jgi:hypothetical protein
MMVAERGADLIKGNVQQPVTMAVYTNKDWQKRQK